MAERIRNQLARAHAPVRPSRIVTLSEFLEPFTPFKEAPESLVHLLMGEDLEDRLSERGFALREKRLLTALPITTGPIVIDGFLKFTTGELTFIENLAAQTSVTVSGGRTADVVTSVFSALTLDQEVEQIAARILEYSARGREFYEMGILLRVREPYGPALESALARFGIPAKFHFAKALSAHPAIQYISGIVRSLLSGWDHADLLPLLRMPITGFGATPEGDRLDFAMRENLPAAGLDAIPRGAANIGGSGPLRPLFAIDPWKHDRLTPADWVARLKTLRSLIPFPEQLQAWRSTSAALDAFDKALDIAAIALDDTKLPLAGFWSNVETAIRIEKFRVPDRRRNVVNVFDIYEARQWDLRIAFVPGLTERHFPKDPSLFELATTSATEQTILSYPRFNDKGDAVLRSFFLEEEGEPSRSIRILPKPVGQGHTVPSQAAPDLRTKHAKLSPTSIESFVQCPFQFFAGRTLELRPRPLKPRDRLDILLQGSILHQAIAEESFDPVFAQACRKNNVLGGYRTEAVRLELLRHFEAFQADRQWPLNWPGRIEEKFHLALTPELSISGRIDRLIVGPNNQAIVIDYKYSPAAKIRERVSVQGALYLLAAERVFHLEPAGMFYCALREPISWEGWHANVPGLTLGEWRTADALRELIVEAEQQAIETFNSIVSGNKEVNPADPAKCRYCDYRNICRVESRSNAGYWLPATGSQ